MDTLVVDSATRLGPDAFDAVVVCGSHGGLYPAWLAARAGARAVVLNDAGVGRHQAGIAGVRWLGALGIAACAVDYRSARIGDGADTLASGIVTTANDIAAQHGCLPGHTCRQAVKCLIKGCEPAPRVEVPEIGESRARVGNTGHREVWALDSVSLAVESDARKVVVTGSHAGLLEARPATACFQWTCSRRFSTTQAVARTTPAMPACRRSTRVASRPPPSRPTARVSATAARPTHRRALARERRRARLELKEGKARAKRWRG